MATTTIRIDIATLPDHLDRSRPATVAGAIEAALRQDGIRADCSDLFSHLKIDLPTAQLAAASAVLVELKLIGGSTMSTRAQIAIPTGLDSWAHVYVHFDGCPAHMLPALAGWKLEDILAGKEIWQVTPEALDYFSPTGQPRTLTRPTREFAQLCIRTGGQWVHVVPLANAHRSSLGVPGV